MKRNLNYNFNFLSSIIKIMKKLLFFLITLAMISCSTSNSKFLELPSIVSDGMVLQQNTKVVLWGKTSPNRKVEITSSWGVRKSVRADDSGDWKIKITTIEAGGPYELVFQTKDTSIVIQNVLLGEVWLGSGQSNMEMPLGGWPPSDTIENFISEIASANYSQIRLYTVPKNASIDKVYDAEGRWEECTPESVTGFSATAYFFGREIHQKLGVPVGLIHTSWGGTPAESWVSEKFLKEIPEYSDFVDTFQLAKDQFDTVLKWMNRLQTVVTEKSENFYRELNFVNKDLTTLNCDDSDWSLMKVPANWNGTELEAFDGIACFRKEFELPESLSGKDLVLNLGPVDDMDDTYINGERIGETLISGQWNKDRIYHVNADVLRPGKNILTVFVVDNMGGGGIYSSSDITLTKPEGGGSLILNGDWKFLPVAELINSNLHFYDNENPYQSRPELSMAMNQNTPSLLFNGMIQPVIPYTLKGVIWYQGESNVGRGFEYRTLFPALINCWRSEWGQGDFPFYFTQIAPWDYDEDIPGAVAEIREAQMLTMSLANTGMVVTTDIGDLETIHPSNKQEVGKRLALWALAKDYGFDSLVFSGPIYDALETGANKAIVHFKYSEGGLMAKNGALTHFEIAGNDQVYYPAHAEISEYSVVVRSEKVKEPVAVRYGWEDIAEPNLFNAAGLPASPFRSDDWKRLSEQDQ